MTQFVFFRHTLRKYRTCFRFTQMKEGACFWGSCCINAWILSRCGFGQFSGSVLWYHVRYWHKFHKLWLCTGLNLGLIRFFFHSILQSTQKSTHCWNAQTCIVLIYLLRWATFYGLREGIACFVVQKLKCRIFSLTQSSLSMLSCWICHYFFD